MDLNKFFKEKEIPFAVWEINHNDENHIIDSETVIEAILTSQGEERNKISKTLSILDFKNAKIIDYLKFLAECMVKHDCDQRRH